MRWLIFILLLCVGCRQRQLPSIDTAGLEPIIVAQIESAIAEVRAKPGSDETWGKLAMTLHAYELNEPARICYQHAAELDRKDPRWALSEGPVPAEVANLRVGLKAWSDKAQQLLANAKHAEAAPLINDLIQRYPNAPEPWLLLGRLRLEQNDCAGAEEALRRLLQIAPDSVNAHFQVGIALICLERYADAIPILKRAIELKPDFGEAHYNLGFALARAGDGHAAIPAFRSAIRYNPDFIDPYITLADLLAQIGEIREAIDLLQRALKLNPADERAKTLLSRLRP